MACSQAIKTRLIMIWFATCDKVDPDELELLLAHARLDKKYKDAIDNLSLLGVQLSKSANKQGEKSSRWHRKKRESVVNQQQDVPFDLSRYVPIVKRVVEVCITCIVSDPSYLYMYMDRVMSKKRLIRACSHYCG